MNLHTPQTIFFIGLLLYLAIRAVYQKRAAGAATTVTRSNYSDRLLVLFVIFGQIILPLLYLFSPWLNFANYQSSIVAIWLGAGTWFFGLWALGVLALSRGSRHKLVSQFGAK
jgi:hypothetical protein